MDGQTHKKRDRISAGMERERLSRRGHSMKKTYETRRRMNKEFTKTCLKKGTDGPTKTELKGRIYKEGFTKTYHNWRWIENRLT
jgi:hypothetical protein